jgi:hypothetical protein
MKGSRMFDVFRRTHQGGTTLQRRSRARVGHLFKFCLDSTRLENVEQTKLRSSFTAGVAILGKRLSHSFLISSQLSLSRNSAMISELFAMS